MKDVTVEAGQNCILVLFFDECEETVAAGFNLVVPEEFGTSSLTGMSLFQAPNHRSVAKNNRYLIYSDVNDTFKNYYDGLMDFQYTAPSKEGTYTVYVKDIQFAKTDYKLVTQADFSFTITVTSPNGIDIVDSDSKGNEAIYSVDGIKRENLSSGINVIRSGEGKVRKIIKK